MTAEKIANNKKNEIYIRITDGQFHKILPTNPQPIDRVFSKLARNKKPSARAYTTKFEITNYKEHEIKISFPLSKEITKNINPGTKIHLILPKNTPIYEGKDVLEYEAGKKRQHQKTLDRLNKKYNN